MSLFDAGYLEDPYVARLDEIEVGDEVEVIGERNVYWLPVTRVKRTHRWVVAWLAVEHKGSTREHPFVSGRPDATRRRRKAQS